MVRKNIACQHVDVMDLAHVQEKKGGKIKDKHAMKDFIVTAGNVASGQ